MRNVDRRMQVSRRVFLRGSAAAVPAAALAAAGASFSPDAAWSEGAKTLSPHVMTTLVLVMRDIYPHDMLADTYYIQAVSPWDGKAAADPAVKSLLEGGVQRLDGETQARFGTAYIYVLSESDRVAVLQGMEATAFFKKLQGDGITSIYNNHDVWRKFGYEGASADKGGYIHRGFDDVDWLPKA